MIIKPPTVEIVPISKLKPWAKNPRIRHDVDGIARSMESFGYLDPIIVQKKTYRILGGHGRLKALKKNKVKEVPVIIADISDRNADLFTIADNKLTDNSQFDMKATAELLKGLGKLDFKLTGFDDDELQKLLNAESDVDAALGVAKKMRKVTFYAGQDSSDVKTIANDRTLVVVFDSEKQLALVKQKIHKLQAGNHKSIGDIVYSVFSK